MVAHSKPRGMLTMLIALFVFLQATAALQHASHHHVHRSNDEIKAHLEETRSLLEERANNIAITGVRSVNGVTVNSAAPRLEIRTLQNNADQWNLYLLGMERFKAKAKTDRLSYYAVAGVHGRPYVTWNNFPTPLVNNAGFCPHAQTLFGSWHRPYLAVYEQAWFLAVTEVIATFPSSQQQRWKNAASTLRMPYWDWALRPASGQTNVPASIRDQTVTVTKPSGRVSIANPLYSYTFGSSLPSEMGGGPFGNFPTTLRRPVANPSRSNNNEVNTRMNALQNQLRLRLYNLFVSNAAWGSVSTSAIGARTSRGTDSFESVHDLIHSTVGGDSGGYMYFLDYSSFDPIFWLHHTNIDRLLHMYQVLHQESYVATGNINRGMAQWNAGESKNVGSPLKPFTKNTAGDYFTSNDVYYTTVFNYYYPETNNFASARQTVINAVNNLYKPRAGESAKRSVGEQYEGRPFKKGDYNTLLTITANKFLLDGSYDIHCFLGSSSSNSTANSTAPYPTNSTTPYSNSTSSYSNSTGDITEDPNYIGSYSVLGGSQGDSNSAVITEGCLVLTGALQGKEASGELKSLHPDDVEPYLAKNLHYKLIGLGGKELNPDDIPDFHVRVQSCAVTPAEDDNDFPELHDYTVLPKATKNLPAGKPFKYTPTPLDYTYQPPFPNYESFPSGVPTPTGTSPAYPTGTMAYPFPTDPEDEEGYCISKQTIEYVDPAGNFLYAEYS